MQNLIPYVVAIPDKYINEADRRLGGAIYKKAGRRFFREVLGNQVASRILYLASDTAILDRHYASSRLIIRDYDYLPLAVAHGLTPKELDIISRHTDVIKDSILEVDNSEDDKHNGAEADRNLKGFEQRLLAMTANELRDWAQSGQSAGQDAVQRPWHLDQINARAVRFPSKGRSPCLGKGSRIILIDFGINVQHPLLNGVNIIDYVEIPSDLRTPIRRAIPISQRRDLHGNGGHGTFVASLMVSDQLGLAPEAELVVAALEPIEGTTNRIRLTQLLDALRWSAEYLDKHNCAEQTAAVNMSLEFSQRDPTIERYLEILRRARQTLPVAASGNHGRLAFPARVPEVLSVGAVDVGRVIWPQSGRDDVEPLLYAPGVNVLGAHSGGGVEVRSGTSYSSALVSAAAALSVSADRRLGGNSDELKGLLLSDAVSRPLPCGARALDFSNFWA
ncbi:MAG: S8/S53 family peptidase [Hyphomicrobiaceae bacterium]